MKVDLFDFELPRACIAQRPVEPRDAARLMEVASSGVTDAHVRDLDRLLRPGDVLVVNDTRVIPSRLVGRRGEAKVEVTLHKREGGETWAAFARPARKLKLGDIFHVADDLEAECVEKRDAGELVLRFSCGEADLMAALERHGMLPLPPYIERSHGSDDQDARDYQTVFAREKGAVAAPTAGLHFTSDLLERLAARGVTRETVTLHVGAGTFLPVKVDDTRDHRMHAEWGHIDADTAMRLESARAAGGRIVAVGTTSLRLLESAARDDGRIRPFQGETDIFITPGYRFNAVDLLLTNFHLPRSTLFMLVCAFSGTARMQAAYAHAIATGYRFYSYGDCGLLHRITDES